MVLITGADEFLYLQILNPDGRRRDDPQQPAAILFRNKKAATGLTSWRRPSPVRNHLLMEPRIWLADSPPYQISKLSLNKTAR
jgi:hypothetical protein